jgi:hypothetical protein
MLGLLKIIILPTPLLKNWDAILAMRLTQQEYQYRYLFRVLAW